MTSRWEEIVEDTKRAYELQLQVAEKLRNRDQIDLYQAGMSLLSSGIRFTAVFGGISKGYPFFRDSWGFLSRARESMEGQSLDSPFNPELAYKEMQLYWGLAGLAGVLREPGTFDYLRVACESLRPGFNDEWSSVLKRRLSEGVEELKSVSVVQLLFLGLLALMRLCPECRLLESYGDREVRNALMLPVLERYRTLRTALGSLAAEPSDQSQISGAMGFFSKEYSQVINPHSYDTGLIAGFGFEDAWLFSVVREHGDFEAGAIRLFS